GRDFVEGENELRGFPGVKVYGRLTEVPKDEAIDFVFISVPRENVLEVMGDCVKKGVKLATIFTTNFADEESDYGRKLQKELLKRAENKVRILGPNGMGLYFPRKGIRWRTSLPLSLETHKEHDIGLVAQSGGLSNLIIHALDFEGFGISKAFSIGNAADVNLGDVINYLMNDKETNIIISYIEGLPEGGGRVLLNLLKRIKKKNKIMIAIKAGKSQAGVKAAISHTASLIGNFNIWKSALHQSGAILIETLDDLINMLKFLKSTAHIILQSPYPQRKIESALLISISGGYGVISSDILSEYGVHIKNIPSDLVKELEKIENAPGTSYKNPLDFGSLIYKPDVIYKIIRRVLDFNFESASKKNGPKTMSGKLRTDITELGRLFSILIFEIPPLYLKYQMRADIDLSEELSKLLIKLKNDIKEKGVLIPILVIIEDIGFDNVRNRIKKRLQDENIPVFRDILDIARTLKFFNESL
ncbi:MAG: CoA-binding protein, partial [Promethearchaeota archaeon]